MPGAPLTHYFHWNISDSDTWEGCGSDTKGSYQIKPVNSKSKEKHLALKYTEGTLKCKKIIFTILKETDSEVSGDVSYEGCKYKKSGQELIGFDGTWEAKREK